MNRTQIIYEAGKSGTDWRDLTWKIKDTRNNKVVKKMKGSTMKDPWEVVSMMTKMNDELASKSDASRPFVIATS